MAKKISKSNSGRPDVAALLAPKNVVISGASDRPGNWAQRIWRNLHRYEYPGKVYPLNPGRDEVWGKRCYRSFADLPEPPDHVTILVPAKAVCSVLRDAAAAGARSATVISSGFDETHEAEGIALGQELARTIAETGLAVSGPNCLGNINGAANFVAMSDDRTQQVSAGPIAITGQSGGLVMAIRRTLEERGMSVGYMITSGNEAGLTTSDYIDYFAQEDQIKVIVAYLESVRDPDRFLAACDKARRAGKPVVVVKLGASEQGRDAALAHTGALAGTMSAFDAIAGDHGVLRVRTLDDVVETCEFVLHARTPKGNRLGGMTFSGGLRGMLLDQAEANGLTFPAIRPATRKQLEQLLGVGTIIGNPLDSGFAALSSGEVYVKCVQVLLKDPGIDILLLQEELPRGPGSERKEANLHAVNALAAHEKKPIAFVTMISHGVNDYARALRAQLPNVAFLQEPDKALRTLQAITSYTARTKSKAGKPTVRQQTGMPAALTSILKHHASRTDTQSLSETDSKKLFRAYGLRTPKEKLVKSLREANDAARTIGFPLVLKVVGAELTHKSEIGGVLLDIGSMKDLRDGYKTLHDNVARHAPESSIDGILVAEQIKGEAECVIGAIRDPEMGTLIMFGAGGVLLELARDVAFSAPVFDEQSALALIERTSAHKLIEGYRGDKPLNRGTVVDALIGISRLACDLGNNLDSIDVNPFTLDSKRGFALDALVILSRPIKPEK